MTSVVFYFHVHQPYRLRDFSLFSLGENSPYFSHPSTPRLDNRAILEKVARKCYLPMNNLLLKIIEAHPNFRVSFSISGVVLDQFEAYAPEVIESFKQLVDTGKVELVNETYYHSLSFMYSREEFGAQVALHKQRLIDLFGYRTTAFRNTELIYNNEIAVEVERLGFDVILAEGVPRYLGYRSPNYVYEPVGTKKIRLLLKNYILSDDIAFRFSSREWNDWPLTAPKYATWISEASVNSQVINLFMDYETFGEHQWEESGIFDFMWQLPHELAKNPAISYATVSEASKTHHPVDRVDMPLLTSWADVERDLSAWMSNGMQLTALSELYALEESVKKTRNRDMIENWRKLTTSDHFYYMCTKWFADGDVHKYFSPNTSPYEAYKHFILVLQDLRQNIYASS